MQQRYVFQGEDRGFGSTGFDLLKMRQLQFRSKFKADLIFMHDFVNQDGGQSDSGPAHP